MSSIAGTKIAIERFESFQLREFRVLDELKWYLCQSGSGRCIDVKLLDQERMNARKAIVIRFQGVGDLRIEECGATNFLVDSISIADVSDRQLERFRWQLFDYEENRINFYSESAEIITADWL